MRKYLLFFFLIVPFSVICNNVELNEALKPRPTLPLNQELPVQISKKNTLHTHVNEKEIERNRNVFAYSSFPWLEIVLLLLIAFWFIILKIFPFQAPEESPENRIARIRNNALKDLDALRSKKIPSQEFYTTLTSIVRSYLENRYQLPALRQTTPEFLDSLSSHPILPFEERQKLSQFMIQADRIKFAKQEASQDDRSFALTTARDLLTK